MIAAETMLSLTGDPAADRQTLKDFILDHEIASSQKEIFRAQGNRPLFEFYNELSQILHRQRIALNIMYEERYCRTQSPLNEKEVGNSQTESGSQSPEEVGKPQTEPDSRASSKSFLYNALRREQSTTLAALHPRNPRFDNKKGKELFAEFIERRKELLGELMTKHGLQELSSSWERIKPPERKAPPMIPRPPEPKSRPPHPLTDLTGRVIASFWLWTERRKIPGDDRADKGKGF